MAIKASNLRKDIYRLLDQVLQTGKALKIERKGKRIKVIRDFAEGEKLARIIPHDCIKGDPEDIVHLDWSGEWTEDKSE